MVRSAVIALLALAPLFTDAGAAPDPVLSFLEPRVKKDPGDFVALNRLADRYLNLQRITGLDDYLWKAERTADQSLKAAPPDQNNGGLACRARVELASHRFVEAHESARQLCALLPGANGPLLLLGDASLEIGDYEEARRAYDDVAKDDGSTADLEPRLARLDIIYGRLDSARFHFAKALALVRELAPPPRDALAWCHVQIGELAFKQGDWKTAEENYLAAVKALPEGYSAQDHLAELRAAQGRGDEAIALYKELIARVPRPELQQALGDFYLFSGNATEAKTWHDRAAAGYLLSVEQGRVQYYHHLAGFYSDSQENGAKALDWARKDSGLRHSIFAYDSLAWAFYKNGQIAEAAGTMNKALATGTRDSHLLYHAAMIRMSAGDIAGGKAALTQAVATNPRYNTFHVHR